MENLGNISQEQVSDLRENYTDPHHIILTEDDASLFLRSWSPDEPSDTAVLILHGITAYGGPYEIIAKPLKAGGFQVFALDLRGHGLSSGNRGDYQNEQVLLRDLEATLNYIRKTLNYNTIVLVGHSLGVLTSLKVVYHQVADIDGLVLFSAAEDTREGVRREFSMWQKIKILISSIFRPSTPVITYYREGMLGLDDPLFNFKYTLRFFKIFDPNNISFPNSIDYPVYMGIGDQDELFTVEAAKKLFEKINSPLKEFKVLEKSKHAEFSDDAFDHFVEWMRSNYT